MGLYNSLDIFQEKINELFPDLETILAYIDDLLIIMDESYEHCLGQVQEVMKRLNKFGLKST